MPKLQSTFIEIALLRGCSPVNLQHIFRTPFPKNNSGWLLLILLISNVYQNYNKLATFTMGVTLAALKYILTV